MIRTSSQKGSWQKVRKFFNDVHLWLGLASGIVLILVCFSGTVYTFNTELTEAGASHLYNVEPPPDGNRIAADSFIAKIKDVSGGEITSIQIPHDPHRSYQFNTKKKKDKSRFGTTYMVNPYTGEILGNSSEENSMKEFMGTMFSLHRWLLLDKIDSPLIDGMENRKLGSMITGWATIIFTLGCLTGLVIWFPQKWNAWRQGLKIKWKANWKRVNHDLHNTLAFYSLIFLLLMGLTGPQWSFDWYREGLQKTLGTYKPGAGGGGERREKKPANAEKDSVATLLAISDYLAVADLNLPYDGNYTISFPAEAGSKLNIAKTRVGFFAPAAGDRLTLDPGTAKVIKKEIFRDKPLNERIAGSIKALHVGNVYGTSTKILYFIACLIATSLPVTGTLIWLNKMKKKKRPKKQVVQPQPALL